MGQGLFLLVTITTHLQRNMGQLHNVSTNDIHGTADIQELKDLPRLSFIDLGYTQNQGSLIQSSLYPLKRFRHLCVHGRFKNRVKWCEEHTWKRARLPWGALSNITGNHKHSTLILNQQNIWKDLQGPIFIMWSCRLKGFAKKSSPRRVMPIRPNKAEIAIHGCLLHAWVEQLWACVR